MTIQEMHIEVRQSTQKIAAAITRKLYPEEIDWLLNKNIERFIQSRVKPKKDGSGGFEIDQLDVDAIRTLLKTHEGYALTADGETYTCELPADYSYLISDDSKTKNLCGSALPALTTSSETILKIPFPKTTKADPLYYTAVTINIGASPVTLSSINTSWGGTYAGTKSKEEKYLLRDILLWWMRNVTGKPVYWERYRSLYVPNTFLVPGETTGDITIDGTLVNATTATVPLNRFADTDGVWTANRLTRSNNVSTMMQTPYIKSSHLSPISELQGNNLVVYGDKSFIVSKVRMYYVCKPKRVDLSLGSNCDLPDDFHNAVCDLTTEYFEAMIKDPNWEVKLTDNIRRSVA